MAKCFEHCPMPFLPQDADAADFKYFLRTFENFLSVTHASYKQKRPLLLNALGRDGLDVFDGLPDPKDTYDEAIEQLKAYYIGHDSVLLKRKIFYESKQESLESIKQFAGKLRRLARECNFCNSSEMLRDIFIIGIRDDRLGEKFLSEDASKLTFEEAVRRAQIHERAVADRSKVTASGKGELSSGTSVSHAVNTLKSVEQRSGPHKSTDPPVCFRCGSFSHKANFERCPARKVKCHGCEKVGHFKKMCKNTNVKSQKDVLRVSEDVASSATDVDSEDTYTIFSVESSPKLITCNVQIDGNCFDCVADSGAALNIMPVNFFPNTEWNRTSIKLKTYGGAALDVVGVKRFKVRYMDKEIHTEFYGVRVFGEKPLLTLKTCNRLQINLSDESHVNTIYSCDDSLFTGIGCVKGVQYGFSVDKAVSPKCCVPRRLPPALKENVKMQLDKMLADGVIVEAD